MHSTVVCFDSEDRAGFDLGPEQGPRSVHLTHRRRIRAGGELRFLRSAAASGRAARTATTAKGTRPLSPCYPYERRITSQEVLSSLAVMANEDISSNACRSSSPCLSANSCQVLKASA